jgi:hypothetical protein
MVLLLWRARGVDATREVGEARRMCAERSAHLCAQKNEKPPSMNAGGSRYQVLELEHLSFARDTRSLEPHRGEGSSERVTPPIWSARGLLV